MASVSSLDKDMRNIRLSKYTPQAADEVRTWIEEVLRERLATGDLLEALKDGTALCKYGLNHTIFAGLLLEEDTVTVRACEARFPVQRVLLPKSFLRLLPVHLTGV
jgi:hypothetical protein